MSSSRIPIADVVLEARTGGGGAIYSYRVDKPTVAGAAHLVQLGTRATIGFVIGMREVEPRDLGFPVARLRPLGEQIRDLSLPEAVMDLCRFTSNEYLCPLPVVINLAMPAGAANRLVTTWRLMPGSNFEGLATSSQEALRFLQESGGAIVEAKRKPLTPGARKALANLAARGIAVKEFSLDAPVEKRRLIGALRITSDQEKVEKFLRREGVKKPAQAAVVIALQGSEASSFTAQEIKALANVTDVQIRSLLQLGILESASEAPQILRKPPTPNSAQQTAIDTIAAALAKRQSEVFLLFGITGSGKTEVYLRAAEETLRQGRRVLFLVPEIALTPQVISQLRERFGRGVALVHSALPPRERLEEWSRIRSGEAVIVLGARSALFSPLADVGLIIVDEEHEGSYKQDAAPRYHAKRLATFLAERHRAVLVLGSATPSAETWHDAANGKCNLIRLQHRVNDAKLPQVHVEDLGRLFRERRASMFSDELRLRINETVARGEQVILFLNRRAYAQFLLCRDCGFSLRCPDCAVALSYHLADKTLRCHHCGYVRPSPMLCPSCHGTRLKPIGAGTQKVEETLAKEFPGVLAARLDRDVAKRKGALEETFAKFRAGDIQILAGTQIIAKGLDFPNVTLVGVIAADMALGFPDFRASERTLQLLSQVSGRAGRGHLAGHVVIQTFCPEHPAIVAAANHSYEPFMNELLLERNATSYPPFHRLVNIVVSSENLQSVTEASEQTAQMLRSILPTELVRGPTSCALERLQKRWRKHILLKLQPGANTSWIEGPIAQMQRSDIQIVADVDPYSML